MELYGSAHNCPRRCDLFDESSCPVYREIHRALTEGRGSCALGVLSDEGNAVERHYKADLGGRLASATFKLSRGMTDDGRRWCKARIDVDTADSKKGIVSRVMNALYIGLSEAEGSAKV